MGGNYKTNSVRVRGESNLAQQRVVAGIQAKRVEPRLDAEPRHAVGAFVRAFTEEPVRCVHVAQAGVDGGQFRTGQKYRCFGRFLHVAQNGRGLFFQTVDGEDVRLQRPDREAIVQARRFPDVGDRFLESMELRQCDTLERQDEGGSWFEFQSLSRELDCFIVATGEDQQRRPKAWVRMDLGSRSRARLTSRIVSSKRA